MNRSVLLVVVGLLVAGVLITAGFGFAYQIYVSQENCQEMDSQRSISANCWTLPSKVFVAGGILLGLTGMGLLAGTARWYRSHTG